MRGFIELIGAQFEDSSVILNENSIISDMEGFDSLTAFSIIDAIEDKYGKQIDEKDLGMRICDIYRKVHE